MPVIRRAVIDIGTNSVKLLVADVGDGAVCPVLEDNEQTRLGAGFYETNRLQAPAIARTADAVWRPLRRKRENSGRFPRASSPPARRVTR